MLVTYAEIYIIFISNYAIKGKMAIRTGAEGELYYRLPRRGYLLCGGIGEILTERGLRRPIRAFTNHLEYPIDGVGALARRFGFSGMVANHNRGRRAVSSRYACP